MTTKKKQILTVKNIRNVNMENILQSVIRNGQTTRSILSKENNISLMTVKHIVDNLMEAGILLEKETNNSDVGRNPKMLEISEKYGNIVCVNLTSKDEISYLIYDIYENLLDEGSISFEEMPGTEENYRETLETVAKAVKEKLKTIATVNVGVAVFVPSAYDETVDLVNYDLIPEFRELHIRAFFEEAFEIKNILILHDVFAAARSEYDSLNPKMESQFYFYCGYGVGGFFIHKDEPVAGAEKMAGEVGKMLVSMDGKEDSITTLEEVVSISAVKKMMKERGVKKHFGDLLLSYREGDEQAAEILTPVLNTVAKVLYNLLWVYNPTRVVIDSCKDEYSKMIAEHFQNFVERMKNGAIPIHVQIRRAKYNEYHRMRGCFYMAVNAWIEEIAKELQ